MSFKLAFIGFGRVGQSLAGLLNRKRNELKERYDLEPTVVGVSDVQLGSVMDPEGLDLPLLLQHARREGSLRGISAPETGLSSLDTIRRSSADLVIEVTWSNLADAEPGLSHIRTALKKGCHVVPSNKGPIALKLRELQGLADGNGVQLGFEGTVLSGTPAIRLGREALLGGEILSIEGILNGTTNYILSEMERDVSYEEALEEAKRLGYAEADPTADVEAWDPTAKIVILANALMDCDLRIGDVEREGITGLSKDDLRKAIKQDRRVRLVARAVRTRDGVRASCKPEEIPLTSLLANIHGVTNAVVFGTDVQDEVTLVGPGAGPQSAGYALLADLIGIGRSMK